MKFASEHGFLPGNPAAENRAAMQAKLEDPGETRLTILGCGDITPLIRSHAENKTVYLSIDGENRKL